jgi:hypothetical protein
MWGKYLTKKSHAKNNELFDEYAKKFLYDYEYKHIRENPEEHLDDNYCTLYRNLRNDVYKNFENSLSAADREEFLKYEITLDDMPEIKAMLDKMIIELRTGYYVRDVPINILGYESENNEIIFKDDE